MTISCTFSARKEVREHIVAYTTVTVLAVTLLVVGILARFHLGSLKNVSQLTSNYLMTAGAALIIAEIFVLFIKSFNEQSDKPLMEDKSAPQGAAGSAEVANKDPKNNDVILESELRDYAPFQPLESYFVYQTKAGSYCCYRESTDKWTINLTEDQAVGINANKKDPRPKLLKLTRTELELYKKRLSQGEAPEEAIAQKKLKFEESITGTHRESPIEDTPMQQAPLSPSGQVASDGERLPKTPPTTPMANAGLSTEGSENIPAPAVVLAPIAEGAGDLAPQPTPPQVERSTSFSVTPPSSSPGSKASTDAAAPVTPLFLAS